MAERMNCVQNQLTLHDRALIQRKVAGIVVTGGQDNVQAVLARLAGEGLVEVKPKRTATGQYSTDEETLEELAADHPLRSAPNVVLTPHIASATIGTRCARR